MKTNEDIDKLIKETLTQEEAKFYDELDEQNVFEMLGGLFTGKNSWIMILMNIVTLGFFVGFIYCIVQFFGTENTNEMIKWTAGGFLCVMTVGMIKIFLWMQMDKNALLREIKRLEIQVSSISGKMSE
ncbi:MAG: hypothetical protein KJO77_05435 [Bacteroidia bacterium]|nr:hypothetical protein [Bacteroidia bacterium]